MGLAPLILRIPPLSETAHALKEAGVNALRGGVWKPRTNPYSYQGDDNALSIILQAREETGLPIDAEVMDAEQLRLALEVQVDVLQVGTRNALNYSLLKQIGRESAETNSAVLLKRGRHVASLDEFIAAAEYIVAEGNPGPPCFAHAELHPLWMATGIARMNRSPHCSRTKPGRQLWSTLPIVLGIPTMCSHVPWPPSPMARTGFASNRTLIRSGESATILSRQLLGRR